ncbi:hypothetical protein TSAR_011515 [Trichomalopsis sarcophagae]|uniref:USP domain-containing protein n=1 Tax=Trichomalopsis sarcophagae TaxID=543379 RepID=A0A232ED59_9HYME|nr:hypothetical protein TSAR_011515 [Trichomalopsis sarcophagae]
MTHCIAHPDIMYYFIFKEEALQAFTQRVILDGENEYFCENCNKKCPAIQDFKFVKLPFILTFHLKRFQYDVNSESNIKLNNKVIFPEVLNLNSIIDSFEEKNDAEDSYFYELFSIIIHSGTAVQGHYYAYIKDLERNEWFCFNDSTVTHISKDNFKIAFGNGNTEVGNAYLLVYRRSNELLRDTAIAQESSLDVNLAKQQPTFININSIDNCINTDTTIIEDPSSDISLKEQTTPFSHDSFPKLTHLKDRMRKKLKLHNANTDSENHVLCNSSQKSDCKVKYIFEQDAILPIDENIEVLSHVELDQSQPVVDSVSNLSVDNLSLKEVSNDVLSIRSSKSQRSQSIVRSVQSVACSSEIFNKKATQESEFRSQTFETKIDKKQKRNIAIPALNDAPDTTLLTYPPPPYKGGIDIKYAHLKCLEDGVYVNDIIIDFYLKHWFLTIICYPDVIHDKYVSSHEKPKKLKLHHESNDNSLITETKTPCILVFDSAPGIIPINVGNMIVEYLYWEYKLKKDSTIKLSDFDVKCVYPEVPQQHNAYDCGIFVMQYVEHFFSTSIVDYSLIPSLKEWFAVKEIRNKRQVILELIEKKANEQKYIKCQ